MPHLNVKRKSFLFDVLLGGLRGNALGCVIFEPMWAVFFSLIMIINLGSGIFTPLAGILVNKTNVVFAGFVLSAVFAFYASGISHVKKHEAY